MFSNEQVPFTTPRHYLPNSPTSSRTSSSPASYFAEKSISRSSSYMPPNSSQYSPPKLSALGPARSTNSGGGPIEKTNMMSSENPFVDPARPYEHLQSPRTITSIRSPAAKSGGPVNKTLNLSDENPFYSTYSRYQYPSQVDPSKRITSQVAPANRAIDTKSLNLSEENPFAIPNRRYQFPTQVDSSKRIIETPRAPAVPPLATHDLSDDNPFNTYRPLTIREYSLGHITSNNAGNTSKVSGSPTFTSSIADWIRNNPAPLSHRPIEVQRPAPDLYSRNDSLVTPVRHSSSPSRFPIQKPNSSGPLDKSSLNMSPDNPFADTYGRYYYPSADEIKAQKRLTEAPSRPLERSSQREVRSTSQLNSNSLSEHPSSEKKENLPGNGNSKFTRFDIV